MDTNLVSILVAALAKQSEAVPAGVGLSNTLVIFSLITNFLTPVMTAIVLFLKSKTSEDTNRIVKKIETDVNSERTNMIKKVDELNATIKTLTTDKAVEQEKHKAENGHRDKPLSDAAIRQIVAAINYAQQNKSTPMP